MESTDISIRNTPEADAVIFSPNGGGPAQFDPAEADVDFDSDDILPSFGVVYDPNESVTLRTSYSQTVARQTFRELSPIFQQEFLGGPVFIGNPDLELAKLQNFDFRLDYRPYDGGLWSMSWFYKDIEDPIENVQALNDFVFTTPVNYEEGELTGWEFEVRQDLGQFWDEVRGLSVGGNVTFIDSEVTISDEEQAFLAAVNAPQTKRDATNAPEYLYNLYATYDIEDTGTQLGLFYTVRGDTLVAGTSAPGDALIPSIYDREFGTLNLTASQRLGDDWRLQFQAKNLTNPKIRQVYRSDYVAGGDTLRSTFTRGMEFSVSLSASF